MPAIARKVSSAIVAVPASEPVDPVGEVRAVHRAGDHEEEERVVEDAEIDGPAGDRDVERGVEAGRLAQRAAPRTTVIRR